MKISQRVSELQTQTVEQMLGWSKFTKWYDSIINVGGVMVLVLSTLSDHALYLYKVLPKYLIGFQSYGPEQ